MSIRLRFNPILILLITIIIFFGGKYISQIGNLSETFPKCAFSTQFIFEVFSSSNLKQPHILLFITDDQDNFLDGMTPMTKTKSWFKNGQEFTNAFVSTPVCCPSRSSILTGKYQHNTKVVNNSVSGKSEFFTFLKL